MYGRDQRINRNKTLRRNIERTFSLFITNNEQVLLNACSLFVFSM